LTDTVARATLRAAFPWGSPTVGLRQKGAVQQARATSSDPVPMMPGQRIGDRREVISQIG